MSFSKEEEKTIDGKMDSAVEKYLRGELLSRKEVSTDPENLSFVFTYRAITNLVRLTENLVRQSNKLSCLTIALIILTIILSVPAIWNLVDKFYGG